MKSTRAPFLPKIDIRHHVQSLVESDVVGIFQFHIDGRILGANDAFLSMLGRTRGDLESGGFSWMGLTPSEWESVDREILNDFRKNGSVQPREKEYWHKTGHRVPVLIGVVSGSQRADEGVAYVIDLSERRAEQKRVRDDLLRAKRDAEAANLAKTQFLANVSHEIRTPLGIILGFASLVKDEDLSESERHQALDTILRNGQQLAKLVDEILDVSKVESNRLEIEMIPFSLQDVFSETAELFGFKAKEQGLDFRINLKTAIPERVKSDPTRIKQILSNLIGNAIKFTERGSVDLDVYVALSEDGSRHTIKFAVTDTGIGLTIEQRTRIFRPFSQADSSTTRRFGGTGLGLHLSRRLARALGGDLILASSRPGRGSVFVTSLPVEIVHVSEAENDELSTPGEDVVERGPQLEGMRILIVDDSADNRSLISRFLKAEGAALETAEDGRDGVAKATEGEFDAVLMDIQMPVMDGYEALAQLRSVGFSKPVFALTAHALKEERERCLAAGFVDHLVKPIDRKRLVKRLQCSRSQQQINCQKPAHTT